VPDVLSTSAEDMLTQAKWRMLAWRKGTKGPLKARFAGVGVRGADGRPQRIGDKGMQHMPGDEVWLVGERRASGEQKCYLANLPAEASLKTLAATIKARWVCEQAHQQLKEELGLDHFEGRSWRGLQRHALMAMIAYAFLQHLRLAAASGEKKSLGRPPSTDAAGHPKSRRRRPGRRNASRTRSPRPAAVPRSPFIKARSSSRVRSGADSLSIGMLPAGQRCQPKARLLVAIQAGCIPTPFPANLCRHPGSRGWILTRVQPRRQHRFLNKKSGFPFRTPPSARFLRDKDGSARRNIEPLQGSRGVALRVGIQRPSERERCH
jgi:hypothetical protein